MMCLAFDRTGQQTPYKEALEGEEDNERDDDADECGGGHTMPATTERVG